MNDTNLEDFIEEFLRLFKDDLKMAVIAKDKARLDMYRRQGENGLLACCIACIGKTYDEFLELTIIECERGIR